MFLLEIRGGRFFSATLLKGKQRIRLAAHSSLPLGKSFTHLVQVDSFYVAKLSEQVLGLAVGGGNLGPSLGVPHTFPPSLTHSLTADRSVTTASRGEESDVPGPGAPRQKS